MQFRDNRFYVTVKDEGLLKSTKVEHRKLGHEVLTLEYNDVILTKHRFYCQVCEAFPHKVYMVKPELWEASELDGFICHECFESRLGRPLEISDLTEAACNEWLKWRISQKF